MKKELSEMSLEELWELFPITLKEHDPNYKEWHEIEERQLLMSSEHEPDLKLVFNKGYTPDGFAEKVYHLHVRYLGDWNELYFRDYLLDHADIAAMFIW